MSKMRIKPRSAKALLCFLSFFLFDLASSVDSPTLPKQSEVQASKESQVERDFLSNPYENINEDFDESTPEEYIRASSSLAQNDGDFKINDDELLRQLKPSNDSEWIINEEILELLDNDPQEVIQCTQPGDRIVFTLAGEKKFKRTMVVHHDLAFISKGLDTNESAGDWTGTTSYTCPEFGPFLIVNAPAFEATGFTINNCTAFSRRGIVIILSGASAMFNHVDVSNNRNRAFYVFQKTQLTLKNSLFQYNYLQRQSGGVMYAKSQGNLTLVNSLFLGNTALYGGAIYIRYKNNIMIDNSILNGNFALRSGGVIYYNENNTVIIEKSSFYGNNATYGGALRFWNNNNIKIYNSTFSGNNALEDGGGIYCNDQNNVTIIQSVLIGNNALKGGVLYVQGDSVVTVLFTLLFGNNAPQGGAIYANRNIQLSITNSNCTKNNASQGGCLYGDRSSLHFEGCECVENSSRQFGGCLYLEACNSNLKSNNFCLNKAKNGGGIYATSRAFLHLEQTHFSSNSAENGGGMAIIDDSQLFCLSCTFKNNSAVQGGGLYVASNSTQILIAQLTNSTFQNNKALNYGGGILVKTFGIRNLDCTEVKSPCDRVVLFGVKFKNNVARFSSIIMATTPDNILVNCSGDFSMAHSMIDREKIKTATSNNILKKLDNEELCSSWVKGWRLNDDQKVEIGTFGNKLNLTTKSNSGSPIKSVGSSRFELDVVRGAREFPTIIMTALDAFGNEHVPLLFRNEALELSSPIGCIQKSDVNFSKNLTGVIPDIFEDITMLQCRVYITPNEDDILNPIALIIFSNQCGINEDLTTDKKSCHKCREGLYNFQLKEEECTPCPKNANCTTQFIVPNEGYWHKSPCHNQVKKCLVEKACKKQNRSAILEQLTRNETNCFIDDTKMEEYDKAQCHKGYKGPLCGSCHGTYGVSLNFECLKCVHAIVVILRFLGAIAYLLIGAIISIKGVLSSPSNQLNEQDDGSPLLESSSTNLLESGIRNQILEEIEEENGNVIFQQLECEENVECSNPNVQQNVEIEVRKQNLVACWKICLNFFQVTSTAASMDVKWTKKILGMLEGLNVLGAATSDSVSYSIDCLISSASNATKAIWRLLFSLFVPSIVILLLALHWGYRCFTKYGWDRLYFSKRLLLTVVTVTYITYFDLTQIAIKVFSCVGVHVNMNPFSNAITRYWIGDTSIECYENTHIILMGIALVILVLVSICFPILCSISLSQKSDEIEDTTSWTYETLGFLGGPFKKTYIYWECITMIKKALLSIIIVFSYSLGNQIQGLLILIVLVLFLYFHTLCYPYAEEYHTLNYYESGSLLISCVTYTLVQFFNVERCSEVTRGIVSLLLIAINGGFVCIMAFKIIREATNLVRAFLESKNIRIPERANIVTLVRVYSKVKRSRFSSA